MVILPYLAHQPRIGPGVRGEVSSAIVGRTSLADGCTLSALTLLRADGEHVSIGANCWFGEASTVHIADQVFPALIGSHVTVGRYGLVHACTVADDCVVGEHAAVMDGSTVGPGAVIAAQSVVPPGKNLAGGWLYAGAPARPVAPVTTELRDELHRALRSEVGTKTPHVFAEARVPRLRHPPGAGVDKSFGDGVYVAPTAALTGRIVLAPRSSVWFGVEIDAAQAVVEIGDETNVQDNSRLYGGKAGEDIRIGRRVLVGHNVRIFPSIIEDDAIIGMGSIVSPGTIVRAGACVAAGSITEPGTEVTAGEVWSGRPARSARRLSDRNREDFSRAIDIYVQYAGNYLACNGLKE